MSITILTSKQESTPASSWKIYLCFEKLNGDMFRLFEGCYEVLGDANDYFNEDDGTYNVPDTINGVEVIEIDGDYILGGEMLESENSVIFPGGVSDSTLIDWLSSSNWDSSTVVDQLKVLANT